MQPAIAIESVANWQYKRTLQFQGILLDACDMGTCYQHDLFCLVFWAKSVSCNYSRSVHVDLRSTIEQCLLFRWYLN